MLASGRGSARKNWLALGSRSPAPTVPRRRLSAPLRSLEVEIEAAGGGLCLPLVLAARLALPVWMLDGPIHPNKGDLPDRHAVIDRDREVRDVRQLQGEVSLKTRIAEARRAVDQKTQAAKRALSLEAAHEIVGQPHALESLGQDEFAGMQDERLIAVNGDELGQILHRFLYVDVRVSSVVENAEV